MVLGPQIATVLFAYGRSSPSAIALLGAVVAAFGVALVPFTGYMILQRGFYALQDTKTPAQITAGVTVIGVAGCLAAAWLLPQADIVVGFRWPTRQPTPRVSLRLPPSCATGWAASTATGWSAPTRR